MEGTVTQPGVKTLKATLKTAQKTKTKTMRTTMETQQATKTMMEETGPIVRTPETQTP